MDSNIKQVVVGDIGTNCWFYGLDTEAPAGIPDGKKPCVVIDPGEEADTIVSRLTKLQWFPQYVFLTHGHFDHLAALPDLMEALRKESGGFLPKIGIHSKDVHYLGESALKAHRDSMSAAGGSSAYVDALWKPLPEADLLFEEGNVAGPFTILHLPGHTQGSIALYDEKNAVLFSGDTLFHGSWGRTDLPGGDEDQLYKSLKRLLFLKGEILVCPGHGPVTTIKDEQRIKMYLG